MNLKFNNHSDSKNDKKQIWIYALVLFTGAFIVLLLTAYSQVKFQNNISEYQSKLSTEEKAKINVVTDYNAAVKEIDRLTAEIESIRNKLIQSEQNLALEEQKVLEAEVKYNNTIVCNDLLLAAYEFYNKGDYVNCAIKLKYDINTALLSIKSKEIYDFLVSKSFNKAAKMLYSDGYKSYKNRKYSDAIESFNRAIEFGQKDEYFMDDAYFYLANSYYKELKYNEAKKIINLFISNYPNSTFIGQIKKLNAQIP
ncbi:tetratricopeptide repeat protein [Ruminiclostridium herbifermentans]|uniref:Tetratricopeptide repeat protein n=1 Tax=Ruminiclostridium herbifermentans TaxID=2488810 RepID=A0A4U7JI75_9FIRM|nr:tetratricopeptide repeat protein [Ruminiclostridium herbifermentans]QNU66991.1 tetratricopeptide repeat protein [Ruminiclostridium herbifermentans]